MQATSWREGSVGLPNRICLVAEKTYCPVYRIFRNVVVDDFKHTQQIGKMIYRKFCTYFNLFTNI